MTLKVEFNCGDLIHDCYDDAFRLSGHLKVDVEFTFNGVTCYIKPNGDKDKFFKIWYARPSRGICFN